jgi:hypothetical protein
MSDPNELATSDRNEPSIAHRVTAEVIKRFDDVFLERDAAKIVDLVADCCVLESTQPAPNGTRHKGYDGASVANVWRRVIGAAPGDPWSAIV